MEGKKILDMRKYSMLSITFLYHWTSQRERDQREQNTTVRSHPEEHRSNAYAPKTNNK